MLTVPYVHIMILSDFYTSRSLLSFLKRILSFAEVFLLPTESPVALKSVFVCDLWRLAIVAHMSMVGRLFTGTAATCEWLHHRRK